MSRMQMTGRRHCRQRAGEEVRRQSKSSQECGPSWARERRATSSAVRCWLSPDQSYVRDPNQRTVLMPVQMPDQARAAAAAWALPVRVLHG